MVRRHVWVSGRVQGVAFRHACAERARVAGVSGWVRNTADGRVEAVFEGSEEAVESLVAWCRTGPALARVLDVAAAAEPPEHLAGFSVRA